MVRSLCDEGDPSSWPTVYTLLLSFSCRLLSPKVGSLRRPWDNRPGKGRRGTKSQSVHARNTVSSPFATLSLRSQHVRVYPRVGTPPTPLASLDPRNGRALSLDCRLEVSGTADTNPQHVCRRERSDRRGREFQAMPGLWVPTTMVEQGSRVLDGPPSSGTHRELSPWGSTPTLSLPPSLRSTLRSLYPRASTPTRYRSYTP